MTRPASPIVIRGGMAIMSAATQLAIPPTSRRARSRGGGTAARPSAGVRFGPSSRSRSIAGGERAPPPPPAGIRRQSVRQAK